MTKRQCFTKEFKLEALRLLDSGEQSGTEIAKVLGIRRNLLYKWQQEFSDKGDAAFQGPGRNAIKVGSVEDLQRENKRLREEVEILKKAAAYFARELK